MMDKQTVIKNLIGCKEQLESLMLDIELAMQDIPDKLIKDDDDVNTALSDLEHTVVNLGDEIRWVLDGGYEEEDYDEQTWRDK